MAALLETLSSYVPHIIRRQLAAQPSPLTTATTEDLPAAVLFADISGFTALAERLALHGATGSEELSRHLNNFFGQLITIISAHGGDVLKFAGDAMLVIWPANDEAVALKETALRLATQRAVQCALAIQQEARTLAMGTQLAVRIGIGAGEVSIVQLGGGHGRWELVIAGEPLVHMATAEHQAQPGQVIVSPQAWALLRSEAAPAGDSSSGVLVAAPPEPSVSVRAISSPALSSQVESTLQTYIPGAVVARLNAGQGLGSSDWLAELRRVSVLFVNLPNLNHTLPIEQAQALMLALQETLHYYEGSINKLNVDDKGVTLVAAMGLPPLAHEDDAARAIQAAMRVQQLLNTMHFNCAIGVTTGRVFCGAIGDNTRREYTMIGDVVNLAARLMQASPGAILCDAATYQSANAQIEFEALPPIKVRGKAEPIPVFRPVVTAAHTASPKTQLIGRQAERGLLTAQLAALQNGKTNIMVIEGEAGIGKTRLVTDLLEQSDTQNIVTFMVSGDAIEKATPYHAWRATLNEIFHISAASDTETIRSQVLNTLGSDLLPLAPLLNTILPIDIIDNDLTEAMTGQVRADNLRDLLIRVLKTRIGPSPALLIIESAHWLDSASWSLTLAASQNIAPLLLVIATRPLSEPFPPEYTHITRLPNLHKLSLDRLSPSDTAALVCQRLGAASLPEPVTHLIRVKAEGHPFFSEELAYALRESGVITIQGGQCHLTESVQLESINFPDTVQGVIISRIDRLDPPLQLALKTASVIGRVFAYRILKDIHPIETDRPQLNTYLDSLTQLDITSLETPDPDLAYIFKHVITHEVTYNLLLFSQRQQLHRAVAEWHERTYTDDLSPFYPLVAYHWSHALETEQPDSIALAKALEYLGRAGEQALRNFANKEAVEFLSEAIRLTEKGPTAFSMQRRARWERLLGEAYFRLGQLPESREHLQRALALMNEKHRQQATQMGQPQMIAALVGQVAQQTINRFQSKSVKPGTAGNVEHTLEQVRAYERLGEIAYYSSDVINGLYAALRALNLAETVGPSPELARAYATICVGANVVSLHRLADSYERRAQDTAETSNDLPTLMAVLNTTSVHTITTGRWSRAQSALERCAEIAERIGDRRILEGNWGGLAHVAHHRGQFAQSQSYWKQLYNSARRYSNDQTQAWGLLGEAEAISRIGGPDHAQQVIDLAQSALPLLARGLDRAEEARAYGLLALSHAQLGNHVSAYTNAERAVTLMRMFQLTSYGIFGGFFSVAEALLLIAETSEPHKAQVMLLLPDAIAALKRFANSFPIGRPRAFLWEGLHQYLRGDHSAANRLWHRALTAAERLAMPYETALAETHLARLASGPQRETRIARARGLFETCGVTDLQQVH